MPRVKRGTHRRDYRHKTLRRAKDDEESGVRKEILVGETDELGYAPKRRPVTPAEVAATLYQALGLDPHRELPGPQNRPIPLVDFGVQPIRELF